ncbi:hypothetical protein EYF80_010269 [Liparis tanakae]|uniref:Uncharacterized protein n=1 Tax=Liparis tanakae TaxID=230148 RepID=A0A4Z2INK0_9TELE|nr:hypothetical protein EYF80_010269 [Liparis tanakae]
MLSLFSRLTFFVNRDLFVRINPQCDGPCPDRVIKPILTVTEQADVLHREQISISIPFDCFEFRPGRPAQTLAWQAEWAGPAAPPSDEAQAKPPAPGRWQFTHTGNAVLKSPLQCWRPFENTSLDGRPGCGRDTPVTPSAGSSWSHPQNPAALGGYETERGDVHCRLPWDDCVEALTDVNGQNSGRRTPIVQQTHSDQPGVGHPYTAWQGGPVDHSGLINTGTLTVNLGKDSPQAPIQDIRSPAVISGRRTPSHRFHRLLDGARLTRGTSRKFTDRGSPPGIGPPVLVFAQSESKLAAKWG